MGCCSPNFRENVKEQEKAVNQKGKDSLPLFIKAVIVVIVAAGGLLTVYFK